jgi:MFS family permease
MRDRPDRRHLFLLRSRGLGCGCEEDELLLVENALASENEPRPWVSIGALSIDQLVAWGILYYAFNVLAAPMALELGVSRRFVAGAFSLALLVSGLVASRVGRVLDRIGARRVLLAGAVLGALSFGALAFVHDARVLVVAFVVLGAAHASSLYEPAFRAIVDWVEDERARSRAMLLLTSIAGFASTAFLPLAAWCVERFGWRAAVLLLTGAFSAIVIPLRLAMPDRGGVVVTRAPASKPKPSRAADLLGVAFALQSFASTGVVVFLVWHLVERGCSLEIAAALAGLVGASQVPGRLLLLPLQRAVRPKHRLPMLFALQAVGLVGIAHLEGLPRVGALVLFGGTAGMMTLERATLVVAWFGRETFGARSGRMVAMAAVLRAASPFAVELLHGRMRYADAFTTMAVTFLAGGAIMLAATRAHRREALLAEAEIVTRREAEVSEEV